MAFSASSQRKAASRTLACFQSEADALSVEHEPFAARCMLLVLTGAVVLALILASIARIDRVVVGTGQLVSRTPTVVVQSLNRAIITSIKVREGDNVREGDVLATLDPTFAAADAAQLEVQIASLDADIARLTAELGDGRLDTTALPASYAALQENLLAQRAAQRTEQLRSLDARIALHRVTIGKLEADRRHYADRVKILSEVEDMRRKLAEQQYGSRLHLLQAIDQRLEMLRTTEYGANALMEARQQLETARADRETFVEQWRTQINVEMIQRRTARDAAAEQLSKARKNEELVNLRAPVDATVLQAAKLSIGSVLSEATPLFTLVPRGAPAEAEISIDPRDIGFIRAGDPVVLKLEAYNYLEHGHAEGRVRVISEDVFTGDAASRGPNARPYYKASVAIERTSLHNVPAGFRLIPGMPVVADIRIGTRTILSYLSHGLTRGFSEAMREP